MKLLTIFTLILFLYSCQSNTRSTDNQTPTSIQPASVQPAGVQNVDAKKFKELMNESNTVILDVRTPEEIAQGKIEGAQEINFYDEDFQKRINELDKDKTYLVYCKGGGRSGKCANMMENAGFGKVYNLTGGYTAWSKE